MRVVMIGIVRVQMVVVMVMMVVVVMMTVIMGVGWSAHAAFSRSTGSSQNS